MVIILAVVAAIGLVAFLATSGGDDEEGGGDDVATDEPGQQQSGETADTGTPEGVVEGFLTAFGAGDCEGARGLVAQQSQGSLDTICEQLTPEAAPEVAFEGAELESEDGAEAVVSVSYSMETFGGGMSCDQNGECEEMEPEAEMETFDDRVTLVQEGEGWKILLWETDDGSAIISPGGASEDDVDSDYLDEEEPSYEDSEDDYSYES